MNRREFSQGAACLVASASFGLPGMTSAQVRKPDEGVEYLTLARRVGVDAPADKIEVIDFFWYNCPHCNAFEPALVAWSKKLPDDVVLKRVPAAFRDDMVPQQHLYYTLETMGRLDLHGKVFHTIHTEHVPLLRGPQMLDWAGKQGLDTAKFRDIYVSFSTSKQAARAVQIQDAYKLTGVPALGIAGRYYTDGEIAKNMERALQVADYLIAEVRKTK